MMKHKKDRQRKRICLAVLCAVVLAGLVGAGVMAQAVDWAVKAMWSKNEAKFTIVRGKDDIRIDASGSPAYHCENCKKLL